FACLPLADRADLALHGSDFSNSPAPMKHELMTGRRQLNPGRIADEQGRAEPGFQVSNTATDRGFLNIEGRGRLAEAAMIRSRQDIANMAHLHRPGQIRHDDWSDRWAADIGGCFSQSTV